MMSHAGGNGIEHSLPARMGRREMLLLTLAAACSAPSRAGAADASDNTSNGDTSKEAASGPVSALYAGLVAVMKAGRSVPFATRYEQLAPVVDGAFDLPAILKGTVGPRLAALTPDEQSALLDSFRRYTVSTYVANFNKFGGERFDILPDQRTVGDSVVVATEIVPKSGKPARLDYVLHSTTGESAAVWKITDILLDGSLSQVAVQRSEFRSSLTAGGAKQLISMLDQKSASLSDGS
ncbi:MAG TPA: ABC transporter substrate-binding protein [Stellaceae bacterium]|nr:ABC transporter substrate-binding protein [Stellaceae bacterium]